MRALDQIFEIFRPAIHAIRSKWENAVISPIAFARKVSYRHNFQRGHSNIDEIIEAFARRCKSSSLRKRSDVQFVNHSLFPAAAPPSTIAPVEAGGAYHLAGSVH